MSEEPLVSIVVINWNGLDDTRECLLSLREVTYPSMRLIVVDNGSDNDEAAVMRNEFGGFAEIIASPENRGFAGGANIGILHALELGCDYVLLLNNDTVVDPAFLTEMVNVAEPMSPGVAAMCPTVYSYERRDTVYSMGGNYSLWRGSARRLGKGERVRQLADDQEPISGAAEVGYADGVCMLIPRAAIEEVGLFDEEYFNYWEETDWCARAREKNLRCYWISGARIWHKAARSQNPDPKFQFLYRRNALLFVRKRGNGLQLLTAILTHVFFFGPLYLLKHPTKIGRIVPEMRALLWHGRTREGGRPLV